MRLVFKAIILSIFLHITYLVVIIGWSYLKTLYYTPDFSAANTVILQNEVSIWLCRFSTAVNSIFHCNSACDMDYFEACRNEKGNK